MELQSHKAEGGPDEPAFQPLSPDEQRVLQLYDQLREIEVKIALLKAHQDYIPDRSAPNTDEGARKAREEASAAKAAWLLRNDTTESVMTANPIIKAVHNSTQATPIESDLLSQIRERDDVSITLSKQSTELQDALRALAEAESENMRIGRHNADLAAKLLTLAEESERRKAGEAEDPDVQDQMALLREEVKASRQRWRVMKGTVSAVVVGSGLNWVEDEDLTRMVLDPEDEV